MRAFDLHHVSPVDVLKRSVGSFLKNDMLTYAAALAYSALFALFPFLVFLIALLGVLRIPQFFDWLREQAQTALPADSYRTVNHVIEGIQGNARGGLLSIGIIAAIWSASSGVRSVMNAMNVAFGVEESRPALKRYGLSVVYTIGLAGLLIATSGLMVIGPRTVEWIAKQAHLGNQFVTLWTWLRWPVVALLLIVVAALIYYVAPNVDQPFALITPGAVVAVIVWMLASFGFSLYVSRFGNYNSTYGSLGGIIVLLLYLYISSAVLLLGAEVNAAVRRSRRESASAVRPE